MLELKFTHTNQLIAYIATAQKHAKNRYADNRFSVLTAFAHHLNMKTLSCFPSVARISAMASVPLRTVERIIREFEDTGLITSQARYNSSSIRYFDLSKLAVTIGGLTIFNKLKITKEQITTNVDMITTSFKELTQAIQKAAYKRGADAVRTVFMRKRKLNANKTTLEYAQERKSEAVKQLDRIKEKAQHAALHSDFELIEQLHEQFELAEIELYQSTMEVEYQHN